jgi:hypothetical protein
MSRARLLNSIAARVGDYREGEISQIDAESVDRWVGQFGEDVQLPILAELDHVLSRSYLRRSAFEAFFAEVATSADLVGRDAHAFWAGSRFFNQQLRGQSQQVMLELFDAALQDECEFSLHDAAEADGRLIYVDDAVYTGMHVINDLEQIIAGAPQHTDLYMVVYAVHNQGASYATRELTNRFRRAGKTVTFTWYCELNLENESAVNSDVLWPSSIPDDEPTRQYAASLTRRFALRGGNAVGRNGFFSSGAQRHLLEQEFLKAGSLIRAENQNLNRYARPLGNRVMESFGFGALIVTYRNCANNCPLVFWSGDYPLFERDNN